MSNVLAIDLETKNMSHDIGGWDNTHMFQVSTVCTWDGDVGTIYIDKAVDDLKKSNINIKPLSDLKFDLDDHFEKGGKLLGHNIRNFDLPVLKYAMDNPESYIDTSAILSKEHGERYSLSNLAQHTLGTDKLMDSADAPKIWKTGGYSEVAEYCLKDCELVFDLWKHGVENKIVKGFSLAEAIEKDLAVMW